MHSLNISLELNCEKSFKQALDEANISHQEIMMFSSKSEFSRIAIAISDAMPWSTFGEVIRTWINANQNRRVRVWDGERTFDLQGYSAKEVAKILSQCEEMSAWETDVENKP